MFKHVQNFPIRSNVSYRPTARWHCNFINIALIYFAPQPIRYHRYRHLVTNWNATQAVNVQKSAARTASVRPPARQTYRPCRCAVATGRLTTMNASCGSTRAAIRPMWSHRPLATAEVGSLNVLRRTGRFSFYVTEKKHIIHIPKSRTQAICSPILHLEQKLQMTW